MKTEAQESLDLLFKYSSSARSTWAKNAMQDRYFMQGAQWDKDSATSVESVGEPALSINEVKPSIDLVISMLTENNPRWRFVGADSYDGSIAGDIADLYEYIWRISNGSQVAENALYDYEITGLGAFMAYVDPYSDNGKGDIKITDIDPLDLYIDPKSRRPDSSDAAHIIISKTLTEEQIKTDFPEFYKKHAKDGKLTIKTEGDNYPSSDIHTSEGQIIYPSTSDNLYRAIDRYTKIKVKRFYVYDTISGYEKVLDKDEYEEYIRKPAMIIIREGQENYETRDYRLNELFQMYQEYNGIFHYRINPLTNEQEVVAGAEGGNGDIPLTTTQLQPTTIEELIKIGIVKVNVILIDRIKRIFTIGDEIVFSDILPISNYPIITFMLHHSRNPYPMSDVRLVRPLQEQLNKVRSKITAYLSTLTGIDVFVPKGSGMADQIKKNAGKPGMKVYEVDMEVGGAPVVAQRPSLPAGVYEDSINIINQIQRIIGAYSALDGNSEVLPRTKGGTILQDQFGQRRITLKRKRLERALDKLAEVIAEMIPSVYTEEKVIRIVKPNKAPKEVVFNREEGDRIINDLSIKYDVRVISGSTMPTNQLERYEMLNNAYMNGILRDNRLLLQNMPYIDNLEEIIEREDKIAQYEGAIQQLQQQIKELQGLLQTKSREVIQAQEKVNVEKTKAKLNKIASEAQAIAQLGKYRVTDFIKQQRGQNGTE